MSETIRFAGIPGDGIGREGYSAAHLWMQAANRLLGRKAFSMDTLTYDAEWYLRSNLDPSERRAWPPRTPEYLAHEYRGAFVGALGDPRLPANTMAHAVDILLKGFRGHPAWNTNMNRRDSYRLYVDLPPDLEQRPFDFELFYDENSIDEVIENEGTENEVVITKGTYSASAFETKLRQAVLTPQAARGGVIVLHKNNVLKHAHDLWKPTWVKVGREYPDVKIQDQLIDSFLERLVGRPDSVPRVLVTDKPFALILEKAVAALKSGLRGLIPDDFYNSIGRENTEGPYAREGSHFDDKDHPTTGYQVGRHTYRMVQENIKATIDIARQKGFSKITVLHMEGYDKVKALWERVAREVCREEGFEWDSMSAGDYIATLITEPEKLHNRAFAADNLIGDLCSDANAAVIGGMGFAPALSYNTTGETNQVYAESTAGSGTGPNAIAGKGIMNPTAHIMAMAKMMSFRLKDNGDLVRLTRRALGITIASNSRTPDMIRKGQQIQPVNTAQFTDKAIGHFLRAT